MKKLSLLLLTAALLLSASVPAAAVDFKARGQWLMNFDYGQHGAFTGGSGSYGYGVQQEDNFEARQRLRLQLEAVASEALSGTLALEIGDQLWGRGVDGAAMGADGTVVEVKHAYLDWMIPGADIQVRMGIQPLELPGMTAGSQVLADDVAAISLTAHLSESADLTTFWARPYNDNFAGTTQGNRSGVRDSLLDNMDLFGLVLPLRLEGVNLTPWAVYGMIGPNTFRSESGFGRYGASFDMYRGGMLPVGGASHRERLSSWGNVWWAGLTGELVLWDPFRLAWDAVYGSVRHDDASAARRGWIASLLAEYKLDWVTPGIYGWYASGDNGNRGDGSERLPVLSLSGSDNDFSHFAFSGNPNIGRECAVGWSMAGTWGVGLRLKDISVIEDVKQSLRVNVIGGTNSPGMARWLSSEGLGANSGSFGVSGMEGLYLTTRDVALEVGLSSYTKIYENMTVGIEAAYMALWLDKSSSVWGNSRMNGYRDDVRDAWNINFFYAYNF